MLVVFITVFGIASLILVHELGHFLVAKKFGLRVDEFGIGFPPRILKKKIGETLYSLNWIPLGGFVKIAGEGEDLQDFREEEKDRLFAFQRPWKKALVVSAGVLVNFVVGWFILFLVFLIGTPQGILVSSLEEGGPAALSGFQSGDVVVGFGDSLESIRSLSSIEETPSLQFTHFISERADKNVYFEITRQGQSQIFPVFLGMKEGSGFLGVRFTEVGILRHSFIDAFTDSFFQTIYIISATFQSLFDLIRGALFEAKISEGVVGPVGIFSFAHETGQVSLVYLLQLLSIISLNLAVLNLIPIPALDGGHLLFILIEKIKGSAVGQRARIIAHSLGVSFLVLLVIALTVRDVQRIFFS